jgi:hypothetical protein
MKKMDKTFGSLWLWGKGHVRKVWLDIHSFILLHSMDPYMARKPVDIEIVNDNKDKSHQ